jgi:hypothetical protein
VDLLRLLSQRLESGSCVEIFSQIPLPSDRGPQQDGAKQPPVVDILQPLPKKLPIARAPHTALQTSDIETRFELMSVASRAQRTANISSSAAVYSMSQISNTGTEFRIARYFLATTGSAYECREDEAQCRALSRPCEQNGRRDPSYAFSAGGERLENGG